MLLTVREVSVMLRLSLATVRQLCAMGILTSTRVAGPRSTRVTSESVDAYLKSVSNNTVGVAATGTPDPTQGPRPRA